MTTISPFSNIAISLSGGGYRATAFHLGVLSYLHHLPYQDKSMLDQVKAISTISGGSITGVRYALSLAKNESFQDFFNTLFNFLKEDKLLDKAFQLINEKDTWEHAIKKKNLINAFAEIYQHQLLENENFGLILKLSKKSGMDFMFNATDLNHSLPFRFQTSGIIGNGEKRVPKDIAEKIRLGDIVAASSCFPAGFEPMLYPDDFLNTDILKTDPNKKNSRLKIMDGGIVDNQGVESILLSEDRFKKNPKNPLQFGTYIISDVSLKKGESNETCKSEEQPGKKESYIKQTFQVLFLNISKLAKLINNIVLVALDRSLNFYFWTASILTLATIFLIFCNFYPVITFLATVLLTISVILLFGLLRFKHWMNNKIKASLGRDDPQIIKELKILRHINLRHLWRLIMERGESVLDLTMNIYMNRIRSLQFAIIFDSKDWDYRTIGNHIYDLDDEKLVPKYSKELKEIVENANCMGTTLWFTDYEKKDDQMLNALIICGQARICYNLILYLEKRLLKEKNSLSPGDSVEMKSTLSLLKKDWDNFMDNPVWLLDSLRLSASPAT